MSDIRAINLDDMVRRYWHSHGVPEAAAVLEGTAVGAARYTEGLPRLLRDYREEAITSRREVMLRDAFDYLLAFYGLMEIASLIGFVPDPLPDEFRERALAHLSEPSVRRYYEEFYPVALPAQFRRRLEGEQELREAATQETAALFTQFLELNRIVEDDEDVDTFLWFLDSGLTGGYSIRDTVATLRDPRSFGEAVHVEPEGQGPLHSSLHGFLKFVNFCRDFESLLRESADYPLLQSAMWEHHAYWFRQLSQDLDTVLEQAFEHFRSWLSAPASPSGSIRSIQTGEESGEADTVSLDVDRSVAMPPAAAAETNDSIDHMQQAVRSLTGGRYHGYDAAEPTTV
jgi:hypothetical protein